jgi:hypothetical protein
MQRGVKILKNSPRWSRARTQMGNPNSTVFSDTLQRTRAADPTGVLCSCQEPGRGFGGFACALWRLQTKEGAFQQ